MLKLAVGYQDKDDALFSDIVKKYINAIEEVYFPFVNCASGRSMLGNNGGYYDYSVQERLISELTIIKNLGVKLNLLLNSNCNGADALSLAHEKKVISILEYHTAQKRVLDLLRFLCEKKILWTIDFLPYYIAIILYF